MTFGARSTVRTLGLGVITGAAYDLAQAFKWKHSLHAKWHQAKKFYAAIAAVTALAVGLNFSALTR